MEFDKLFYVPIKHPLRGGSNHSGRIDLSLSRESRSKRVVLARPTPSRTNRLYSLAAQRSTWPKKSSPIRRLSLGTLIPASSSSTATSPLEETCSTRRNIRRIEPSPPRPGRGVPAKTDYTSARPKRSLSEETDWDFQHILVDLILNAQATGGEPPPSTMAIVYIFSAFIALLYFLPFSHSKPPSLLLSKSEWSQSNSVASSLQLAEFESDKSLSRPYRLGVCREKFSQSSTDPLYAFDPEIERTLRRLRKARNLVVNNSRGADSVINSNKFSILFLVLAILQSQELATPYVVYQPLCIQCPQLEPTQMYELKSGLIHLLPKFHGLAGEDPHKHLKEFHMVSSTMRPQGIPKDHFKMKAFSFSLDGAEKD
ncbi:hypothetical protein CR513_31276, partial [Mucuna pruriens]